MKNYNWFMGIDVSKGKLDITLLKGGEQFVYEQIDNSIAGLGEFAKKFKAHPGFKWKDCLVCVEHTGIYNTHLLTIADKLKWDLCLESAVQIRQSGGLQRGKNDEVDSYRIALYAHKNAAFLKLWQPPRLVMTKLKKLSALRSRLINVRKQLATALKEDKCFLDKSITRMVEHCCQNSLLSLQADIAATDKKIKEVIESDKELSKLFAIVESIPGAGRTIAVEMVITTNEFKNISDPRKYACYSGVAPFEHSSGSSIRGRTRTSKKANQHVKAILHMCSLVAVRCNPELKEYYERKVKENKNKMSILNAVKNKLVHRIFACVNQNRLYEKKCPIKLA